MQPDPTAQPKPAGMATTTAAATAALPWYRQLSRYHWFVLMVASLGWLFDTMDQQLFNLARKPAVMQLIGASSPADPNVTRVGGYLTSVFMVGWAMGGFTFGILGDRIGRAKTMLLTILMYSVFTGLCSLSRSVYDFAFFQFLNGFGVGGEFAVGVSLVAEVMPQAARSKALGALQALSALGNITAALISLGLGKLQEFHVIGSAWRVMFVIGVLPALLSLFIFKKLKEPEKWQAAAAKRKADRAAGLTAGDHFFSPFAELFRDTRWRRNTIVGMLLAFSGVVGLWGIGVFTPDLTRTIFDPYFQSLGARQGLSGGALATFVGGKLTQWSALSLLLFNVGAFFGIYAFSELTAFTGRKPAFAVSFVAAMGVTIFVYLNFKQFSNVFWMLPMMGFCQLALFGGYAIYFPELFPTRLRSTGTSFCYNVGRLVAAAGPSVLGLLASDVYGGYKSTDASLPFRYAGMTMCAVFLIGLFALPFAPETKGKPLPE
jgi:MFS family permease